MLKLVSLNMEGERHLDRILPFLEREAADVICLLEAPELFQHHLQALGYQTSFSPMLIWERRQTSRTEGVIFASRCPYTFACEYYHRSADTVGAYHGEVETVANPLIIATVTKNGTQYSIGTTHVMVTPHGASDAHQQAGVDRLLTLIAQLPPHVLCGDFNIPRGHNDQYERFTERYVDTIPSHYPSSLDRSLHRLANDPNLTDPIFDAFMVDYIFTQSPYKAEGVRLEFGVSDHAAVIGNISRDS